MTAARANRIATDPRRSRRRRRRLFVAAGPRAASHCAMDEVACRSSIGTPWLSLTTAMAGRALRDLRSMSRAAQDVSTVCELLSLITQFILYDLDFARAACRLRVFQ